MEKKDKTEEKIISGEAVKVTSIAWLCFSESHHSGTILFSLNMKIPVILLNSLKTWKRSLISTKNRCNGSLACSDSGAAALAESVLW